MTVFRHKHYMDIERPKAMTVRLKLHCQSNHYDDTIALC